MTRRETEKETEIDKMRNFRALHSHRENKNHGIGAAMVKSQIVETLNFETSYSLYIYFIFLKNLLS